MSIKLFICDLDGTLVTTSLVHSEKKLNWNEEVSFENISSLELLKKNGLQIAIATGRLLGQIEHINDQIDLKLDYVITQNGNYIYDHEFKIVEEKCFNVRDNLKIIKYIREFGFKPIFLDKETLYIDLRYINYDNVLKLKDIYKNNYIQMLNWNNPWEIEHSKIRPGMVSIDVSRLNESQKLDLTEVIQEDLQFTKVSLSSPYIIDIYPSTSSKFEAIKKIAADNNITLDEIAYVGDSGNDICVFENLKHSFCIKHAREDVKKYCNNLVEDVSEAVSKVLSYNETN